MARAEAALLRCLCRNFDTRLLPAAPERSLSALALPMSVTNLAAFAIGVVVLAAAGRLGSFELSCVVLGTSIYNVTGEPPAVTAHRSRAGAPDGAMAARAEQSKKPGKAQPQA